MFLARASFFDEISKNKRNSVLLVLVVILFVLGLIYVFSQALEPTAVYFLIIFSVFLILSHAYYSYYKGQDFILSYVKAYPAHPVQHVFLINTVEGLSIAAGIPPPRIYVIPSKDINAFASGRDPKHAVIAVTEGALEALNREELEGVVGHEISHIRNYDIRFAMMIAVFVGIVAILSHMFLRTMGYGYGARRRGKESGLILLVGIILAVFAPIAIRMVQLAISREREYLADASSAQITRYPVGLARALEKIVKFNKGEMEVSEAASHLFFADPKRTFVDNIFATHPPMEKRINRLREM